MQELRSLKFEHLDQAVDEVQRLLEVGYEPQGRWSLAQICRHLYLVQEASIDGFPRWMSIFAGVRPLLRRWLLPRLLRGHGPRGIRTSRSFQPPSDLDDALEAAQFVASVRRFQQHAGPYAPHPGFGKLSDELLEQVHAAHASHHLRFLTPRTSAE